MNAYKKLPRASALKCVKSVKWMLYSHSSGRKTRPGTTAHRSHPHWPLLEGQRKPQEVGVHGCGVGRALWTELWAHQVGYGPASSSKPVAGGLTQVQRQQLAGRPRPVLLESAGLPQPQGAPRAGPSSQHHLHWDHGRQWVGAVPVPPWASWEGWNGRLCVSREGGPIALDLQCGKLLWAHLWAGLRWGWVGLEAGLLHRSVNRVRLSRGTNKVWLSAKASQA